MTEAQRLTIKASEQRSRLAALATTDELTDELRSELDTLTPAHQDTERQLRAAIAAEGDPGQNPADNLTPEMRERLDLRGRVSLGRFLVAALRGAEPTGAEAEYRDAFKCDGIPIDLFEKDRPEARADLATGVPATGTGVTVAPIQPFVFSASIAPRLGIDMPSVGSGAYSEMTISAALTASAVAKGTERGATAATLTSITASPRSIRARLTLNVEDIAAIGQANFEAALRANAQASVSDELDKQIIAGNGTAPNINGLVNQLTNPTDPGAIATFDDFVAAFADQIDGLWAATPGEVAIVANVDAYKLSAKTFRDGTGGQSRAGDVAFSDYAKAHYGAWFTNKRMPATASTIARGIVYRMGRSGMRTACLPSWGSLTVDDVYTSAASGQRHFTLNTMVGDKVLIVQPDAYDLTEYKVA